MAQVCTVDQQGVDDEPGQKDVNEFCEEPGTSPFELAVSFNFDDTRWTGSNTGDGCVLFDTDDDTFANYALCVTLVDGNGQPAYQDPLSPRLYQCADDRMDRCTNSVEILTFSSTCTVNVGGSEASGEDADPFFVASVPGRQCFGTDCESQDAFVACLIEIDDISPGEFCNSGTCFISGASCSTDGDCVPISDSCAFASSVPNSDPSDCINTATQPTSTTTTSVPTTTTSVPTTTTSEPTTTTSQPTTTTTSEPTTTTSEPTTTTSVPTTTTSQPTTTTSVPITTTVSVTTTIPTTTTTIPSQQIPTLSEWGMIIFVTILLGIGVITILRRREEQKPSIR